MSYEVPKGSLQAACIFAVKMAKEREAAELAAMQKRLSITDAFGAQPIVVGDSSAHALATSPTEAESKSALNAPEPVLTPQQQEAFVAIALLFQNGFGEVPLKEVSYQDALGAVKAAFVAISTKHRSDRAKQAIGALIKAGRLLQTEDGNITLPE